MSPALSLARAANARLRVIAAVPPAVSAGPVGGAAYGLAMAEQRRACERALGDAIDRLPADVGVEWSVEEGFPARILVDASDEVDLLVVGSRGYTPLHAMLVGAVSGRVLRESHCPVLVNPRGSGASGAADSATLAESA